MSNLQNLIECKQNNMQFIIPKIIIILFSIAAVILFLICFTRLPGINSKSLDAGVNPEYLRTYGGSDASFWQLGLTALIIAICEIVLLFSVKNGNPFTLGIVTTIIGLLFGTRIIHFYVMDFSGSIGDWIGFGIALCLCSSLAFFACNKVNNLFLSKDK